VDCAILARLQQEVDEAAHKLLIQNALAKPGRAPSQVEEMKRLQELLFCALSEMQRHEAEHKCRVLTEASQSLRA
jgi:hypothetical protein